LGVGSWESDWELTLERAMAPSARAQLDTFMRRYSADIVATARDALTRLRKQVPGAVELVYDNYNALVVGFAPSERASEAVLSIALYPKWVTLFFLQTRPSLPDPDRLLKGRGTRVRSVVLETAADLDMPAVRALIRAALERAPVQIDASGRRRLVIKSISAKQRPRRPARATLRRTKSS
jgi:hypothetical protein